MNNSPNLILSSLSREAFAALEPHLKPIEFRHGVVLAEAGAPIKNVYFPHSGIVSLVVHLSVGMMIETAMVGRYGVVNAASALDGKISMNKAIVQVEGSGSFASAEAVAKVADDFRDLRALFIRHEQVLFAESQQSAACNASHVVEARLSRWLLHTRDLAGGDELKITQEFLAQMLGVQRTSLSVVANTLQKAGLIRYRRGRVTIVDEQGLKDSACECYEVVKGHYARLVSGKK